MLSSSLHRPFACRTVLCCASLMAGHTPRYVDGTRFFLQEGSVRCKNTMLLIMPSSVSFGTWRTALTVRRRCMSLLHGVCFCDLSFGVLWSLFDSGIRCLWALRMLGFCGHSLWICPCVGVWWCVLVYGFSAFMWCGVEYFLVVAIIFYAMPLRLGHSS